MQIYIDRYIKIKYNAKQLSQFFFLYFTPYYLFFTLLTRLYACSA